RVLHRRRVRPLGKHVVGQHVVHELAEQDLLELERGLIGLLVLGRAVANGGRQRRDGHLGKAVDAHQRFTWLAMPIISSAVVMALEVSWNARWDSIIATMASAMSVLEASRAPCESVV